MLTGLPETWLAYVPTLKDRSYADFREHLKGNFREHPFHDVGE
jgi:hypothetical protein